MKSLVAKLLGKISVSVTSFGGAILAEILVRLGERIWAYVIKSVKKKKALDDVEEKIKKAKEANTRDDIDSSIDNIP